MTSSIDEGEQESDDAQSSASEPDAPSSVSDEVKKDCLFATHTPELVEREDPYHEEQDNTDEGPIVDDENPLYDGNPKAEGDKYPQDEVDLHLRKDWSDDEEILLDEAKLMAPLRLRARVGVYLNPLQLTQDEEDSDGSPPSSPTPCNGERIDLCLRKDRKSVG